jgi:restriction endonuclease S subunit
MKCKTGAIVRLGDVILSSRGNLKAGLAEKELDGAIASASTFILRVKNKEILPEYVASYFNSLSGQISLKRASLNISITALSAVDLSEVKIPVPAIEEQKIFAAIYKNKVRQKELLEQKIKLINLAMEGAIKKIIE